MSKLLVNIKWDNGAKKQIKTFAVHGGLIPPYTMCIGSDKYIMPGWYKLKADEEFPNISDIAYYPYKPNKAQIPDSSNNAIYKVTSSQGDKEYQVARNAAGDWQCTCAGYAFRRSCRHITQVQASPELVSK